MAEKVWIREGIVAERPEGNALAASRCKACGQVYFPKVEQACLNCLEKALEDILLSGKGKLSLARMLGGMANGLEADAVGIHILAK